MDHEVHGNTTEQYNITMRRYACMALTNLTFGDGTNKALLCSMKSCMDALVNQLASPNEDLKQVAASVLRNLSWRADLASKKTLREVGAVSALMKGALSVKKESTLKSILSALWNLSAHCSENKADICAVSGSLAFLVSTLTYKSPSKTLAIIENGGGILRNVSSHIAVREDYRKVLRLHGCLQILLKHLRSPSLTIVSNACGTLWNLSARCSDDQQALWEMGAVSMLRNLVHSKHKMISMGSAAALKNLLAARPAFANLEHDKHKSNLPTLAVRKQRALEAELDHNLAETCDNMDSPHSSPAESRRHDRTGEKGHKYLYSGDNCGVYQVADSEHRRALLRGHVFPRSNSGDSSPLMDNKHRSPHRSVSRSGSQDSVGSVHSDISHDRARVHSMLAKSTKLLQERPSVGLDRRKDLAIQRLHSNPDSYRAAAAAETAGSDRGGKQTQPNSRIVQIMQEVAMHAGIESGQSRKDSPGEGGTPPGGKVRPGSGRGSEGRQIPVFSPRQHQVAPQHRAAAETPNDRSYTQRHSNENLNNSQQQQHTSGRELHYTSIAHRMENLKLNETQTSQDQPINYSLKYEQNLLNNQNKTTPASPRPSPKIGNYVAGIAYNSPAQKVPNVVNQRFEKQVNMQQQQQQQQPNMGVSAPQYSGYAETDLDNMDQPTNFSIRYSEQPEVEESDHHFSEDQPINYSRRWVHAIALLHHFAMAKLGTSVDTHLRVLNES